MAQSKNCYNGENLFNCSLHDILNCDFNDVKMMCESTDISNGKCVSMIDVATKTGNTNVRKHNIYETLSKLTCDAVPFDNSSKRLKYQVFLH